MKPHPTVVTAAWLTLSLLPLLFVVFLCFILESWVWSVFLVTLYILCIVPYGFFVAMPVMVWLFRKPASLHRRW